MSQYQDGIRLGDNEWGIVDPGASGNIICSKLINIFMIVTAAAEGRTVKSPTRAGQTLVIKMRTDGGDCTLTFEHAFNQLGTTSLVLDDAGDTVIFDSVPGTTLGTFRWRLRSADGVAVLETTLAELGITATTTEINSALSGITATAAEINQHCDESAKNEVVTATNVITAAESGKTFFLDALAGFLSTLPAPALGLEYSFIVKTAPTSNGYTIATNGGADIIVITVNELETDDTEDGPSDDNADLITLVANVALPGDRIDFKCDGTKWYAMGQTIADGAVTTSTT